MWVFLTSVRTEIEADIVAGLLDQEGIPIQKKYPGVGDLKATYGLMNGVDLYVPEEQIQGARNLLEAYFQEPPVIEEE